MTSVRRVTLGVVEIALISIGVATLSYAIGRHRAEVRLQPFLLFDFELNALEHKYGPSRNSEHAEEWITRDFFNDQRGGVFVDVGANDYKRYSNTYYLETALGWSGIAVEPQTRFAADYATYRPRTMFVPSFVSDVSNQQAVLLRAGR